MTDENLKLSEAIRKQGHGALKTLYQQLKPLFLSYMLRYTQDAEVRLDAFHEAMIAFYEYCIAGKYDPSKSAPKTMIFMMGKAYLINRLKLERRSSSVEGESEKIHKHIERQVTQQYHYSLTESETLIRDTLLRMGEKCRELLQLFFYRNYSIEAIREQMNYKNENVVSAHKSRCIKQLKELIQENK